MLRLALLELPLYLYYYFLVPTESKHVNKMESTVITVYMLIISLVTAREFSFEFGNYVKYICM